MKKGLFIVFVLLAASFHCIAQSFTWAKQIGGAGFDMGYSIAVDNDEYAYTVGSFYGIVDFDPGIDTFNLGKAGTYMMFINKSDGNGNFIWAKQIDFRPSDYLGINIDKSGNLYIYGKFDGGVDFDPGPDSTILWASSYNTGFITKLDSGGNFIWVKILEDPLFSNGNSSIISSIAFDETNNLYATGQFSSSIDFDPGPDTVLIQSNGDADAFISKWDEDGNFLWAKQFGSIGSDHGTSIKLDDYGNIYSSGYFSDTVDMDPGQASYFLNSEGSTDFYINKFNHNGNFAWAVRLGNRLPNYFAQLIVDRNYNIYLTGNFNDSLDFDPSASVHILNPTSTSRFILKMDNYSNLLWVNHIEGYSSFTFSEFSLISNVLEIDAAYNVYLTGYFQGNADFGGHIEYSVGDRDAFISKINPYGNFLWTKTLGGSDIDMATSIAIDHSNNIYTTGSFSLNADFDPASSTFNMVSKGETDVFVHKISQCGPLSSTQTLTACGTSYFWQGQLLDSSGTYFDTLKTIVGCDSTLTLNLSLKTVDTSISTFPPKLVSNSTGATYQWINCGNGFKAIPGETQQSFVPDTNGFYAVIVTEGICSDTSTCYAVVNAGINELKSELDISVQPNPTKHSIELEFDKKLRDATIKLMSSTGKLLFMESGQNTQSKSIDLSDLPNGLYFLMVEQNGKIFSSKIVKQ